MRATVGHRRLSLALVPWWAGALGCAPTPPGAPEASAHIAAATTTTGAPASVPAEAPSNRASSALAADAEARIGRLDPASAAAVRAARLPVFVFDDAEGITIVRVMSDAHVVAVAARDGERTLTLHTTDVVHHDPTYEPRPPRPAHVRGRPATITTNEGIVSVSWEEAGVSLALEVECARPADDPACGDASYVRARARSIVRIGGEG